LAFIFAFAERARASGLENFFGKRSFCVRPCLLFSLSPSEPQSRPQTPNALQAAADKTPVRQTPRGSRRFAFSSRWRDMWSDFTIRASVYYLNFAGVHTSTSACGGNRSLKGASCPKTTNHPLGASRLQLACIFYYDDSSSGGGRRYHHAKFRYLKTVYPPHPSSLTRNLGEGLLTWGPSRCRETSRPFGAHFEWNHSAYLQHFRDAGVLQHELRKFIWQRLGKPGRLYFLNFASRFSQNSQNRNNANSNSLTASAQYTSKCLQLLDDSGSVERGMFSAKLHIIIPTDGCK